VLFHAPLASSIGGRATDRTRGPPAPCHLAGTVASDRRGDHIQADAQEAVGGSPAGTADSRGWRAWLGTDGPRELRKTPDRDSAIECCNYGGVPTGNRTRVSALKGLRPDRWTMGTDRKDRRFRRTCTLTGTQRPEALHSLADSNAKGSLIRRRAGWYDRRRTAARGVARTVPPARGVSCPRRTSRTPPRTERSAP
jgi:hypothetical protein